MNIHLLFVFQIENTTFSVSFWSIYDLFFLFCYCGDSKSGVFMNFFSFAFADIVIENNEAVRQLQDKLQDALIEYVKCRYAGNLRRLGHLYLLLPALNHMKLLAKQYWFDIKKDGRVMMHKLFLEMLEADSWWYVSVRMQGK